MRLRAQRALLAAAAVVGLATFVALPAPAAAPGDSRLTNQGEPEPPRPIRDSGAGEPAIPLPEAQASLRALPTAIPNGPAAGLAPAPSGRGLAHRPSLRFAARAVPILLADPEEPGTGAAPR